MDQLIFVTRVRTMGEKLAARRLVESLRTFGGRLAQQPFWLFEINPRTAPCQDLENPALRVIPIDVPEHLLNYELGDKVFACACAEEMAPEDTQSLVWIDPLCLVAAPPLLYDLGNAYDAAVRPVHIRNIGLGISEPLDGYWQRVYQEAGVKDSVAGVKTFVDGQSIRAYYNTHAFAINPARKFLHRWLVCFENLVRDREFQAGPCRDELHQVFLHQAVFSALMDASISLERLQHLPPEYNYPYHLHQSVSPDRRAKALNDLATFAYEDCILNPDTTTDVEIHEPLRSWLAGHF